MTTLWRFGSSLYLFFAFLLSLVGIFIWLIMHETQTGQFEIPVPLELFDFTYYKLEGGDIALEAKAPYAFRDTAHIDHIHNLSLTQFQDGQYDFVYADTMHKEGDFLFFPHGILYFQNENGSLWSENGTYHTINRIFEGTGAFSLQDSLGSVVTGEKLYYDYGLGLLMGDKIQSHIVLEQK
ncbi:MAG: hypothetical protein K2O85_07735 [Helicobacter sp.]|nr:hypothetical protein [Helicobacter sp.]